MAAVESTMVALHSRAANFVLPNPHSGKQVSLIEHSGSPLVVMFLSNHCPFVKHLRSEINIFAADVQQKGVVVIGINSNDVANYPADSPEKMIDEVNEHQLVYQYLFDEQQSVAKAYSAACTPDFFVFDAQHTLFYRGQFDGSRPGNGVKVSGTDIRGAVDALLAGKPPPQPQIPSIGCSIKWKSSNSP